MAARREAVKRELVVRLNDRQRPRSSGRCVGQAVRSIVAFVLSEAIVHDAAHVIEYVSKELDCAAVVDH